MVLIILVKDEEVYVEKYAKHMPTSNRCNVYLILIYCSVY